jgi:HSP20 family protein
MNKVMNNPTGSLQFAPWSVADLLRRDMTRVSGLREGTRTLEPDVAWSPATDILEKEDCFEIRADLPGMSASEIDVSMNAGILSISGERSVERDNENDKARRLERPGGRFIRRFSMPDTASAEGITARVSNGILVVSIPKQPELKARRIAVEAA